MSRRHENVDGIVVRRRSLPSGDVVVTLLTREGPWRGVARKSRRLGGTQARLSLFHDVSVQGYRRAPDDLAVITQATLVGALRRLTEPDVYPYAHVVAELAERLAADAHEGGRFYDWVASAFRGLDADDDPVRVALVHAWMLLRVAGFGPVLENRDAAVTRIDVAAGRLRHGGEGLSVPDDVGSELVALATGRAKEALALSYARRDVHLRVLERYVAWHVDTLKSFSFPTPSPPRDVVRATVEPGGEDGS